jgi:hypothetical protein
VLAALALGLAEMGGCAMPAAALQTMRVEQSLLDGDGQALGDLYDRQVADLRDRQSAIRAAAFADIQARKPLEAQWVIETVRVADAAAGEVQKKIDLLAADRATALANLARRKELLQRAIDLSIRTQALNTDTEQFIESLMQEVKK